MKLNKMTFQFSRNSFWCRIKKRHGNSGRIYIEIVHCTFAIKPMCVCDFLVAIPSFHFLVQCHKTKNISRRENIIYFGIDKLNCKHWKEHKKKVRNKKRPNKKSQNEFLKNTKNKFEMNVSWLFIIHFFAAKDSFFFARCILVCGFLSTAVLLLVNFFALFL